MTVEDKLGLDKFNVDEENCHIKIDDRDGMLVLDTLLPS